MEINGRGCVVWEMRAGKGVGIGGFLFGDGVGYAVAGSLAERGQAGR